MRYKPNRGGEEAAHGSVYRHRYKDASGTIDVNVHVQLPGQGSATKRETQKVSRLANNNRPVRVTAPMDKSMADQKGETAQKRRELAQAERRISDLDVLFQRIYEDNISGKLSDERFSKLSKSYEDEQRTLTEKAKALHAELDKEQAQAVNVAQFIALVKKYSEIDTLTPAIFNEFIERINVHAPDKSSGHRTQQIDIVYNFIGILPTPQAKEEAA